MIEGRLEGRVSGALKKVMASMSATEDLSDLDEACRIAFKKLDLYQYLLLNRWERDMKHLQHVVKPFRDVVKWEIRDKKQPLQIKKAKVQAFQELTLQLSWNAYEGAMKSQLLELKELYIAFCCRWVLCENPAQPTIENGWPAILELWKPYHTFMAKTFGVPLLSDNSELPVLEEFEEAFRKKWLMPEPVAWLHPCPHLQK